MLHLQTRKRKGFCQFAQNCLSYHLQFGIVMNLLRAHPRETKGAESMKRFCGMLLAAAVGLGGASAIAQERTERSESIVVTGAPPMVMYAHGPSHDFARIYSQTEQWRVVHMSDVHNGIRLLLNQGPEMGDYLASLINNSAQCKHDWVFWSLACGTLAQSGGDARSVLRGLAANRSADPWARVAARDALSGYLRP